MEQAEEQTRECTFMPDEHTNVTNKKLQEIQCAKMSFGTERNDNAMAVKVHLHLNHLSRVVTLVSLFRFTFTICGCNHFERPSN